MPRTKRKDTSKPELFEVFWRQRMGADARTAPLTPEQSTGFKFPSKRFAVGWIQQQGPSEHDKIYSVRDRTGKALICYSWKHDRKVWDVLNRGGYYGGYQIGHAAVERDKRCMFHACCHNQCKDPVHPSLQTRPAE